MENIVLPICCCLCFLAFYIKHRFEQSYQINVRKLVCLQELIKTKENQLNKISSQTTNLKNEESFDIQKYHTQTKNQRLNLENEVEKLKKQKSSKEFDLKQAKKKTQKYHNPVIGKRAEKAQIGYGHPKVYQHSPFYKKP